MSEDQDPRRNLVISRDSLDYWQLLKRDRISQFIDFLREVGEVRMSTFIGKMCVQGFHEQTVRRYLRELSAAELIRLNGDKIIWIGDENG